MNINSLITDSFSDGYLQGKLDMRNNVIKWLQENWTKYLGMDDCYYGINLIEDFTKNADKICGL